MAGIGCAVTAYYMADSISKNDATYSDKGFNVELILAMCGLSLLGLFFAIGIYSLITEFFIRSLASIGQIRQYSEL